MSTAKQAKKLAIIDGKSVFYRGYYAMPNLATNEGVPTGGVYGFATMALEVIRRLKPDYVAVAWDKPKTNIRKRLQLYPHYKANRKPAPPDFYEQIDILQELLAAFGWPLYELDDYEADDIMGTLALQAGKQGIETLLVTSDLDMLQLVNHKSHVYVMKQGLSRIELYSPESFASKYGIQVKQFLDLKALKGDPSDNIPGVPGIGEKTAISLLQQYDTLDNIYDHLELLPDKLRQKLADGKDSAYLSKKLSAIWLDAPITLDLKELSGEHVNVKALTDLLQKLQFKSLLRQLPSALSTQIADLQNAYFVDHTSGQVKHVRTKEELLQIALHQAKQVYMHSRSAGVHGTNPQFIILSDDCKTTYALDIRSLPHTELKQFLNKLPPLIGHDLKATTELLLGFGVQTPIVKHDTLVGGFVINSLRRDLTLTDMARTELDYQGGSLEDLDPDGLLLHAGIIMNLIKHLYNLQTKQLHKNQNFVWLVENLEWPIIPVLAKMELAGIKLNVKYMTSFGHKIDDMLSDIAQSIYGYADLEFNIASPAQLAEVLFDKLKLPAEGIKKGKNGYSTAASELDKLRGIHPIIDLISQYREVAKLKNTYVDTLPKLVDQHSRIHTTFNLTATQTGRLSSTDPNLQNIPIRTDLGRQIRTAFIAGKGNQLVSADYSQFELRLAAVLAKDEQLIEMFNRGADVHLTTAAAIYGRNPEDVTKQMRSAAKAVNFGILYGMSPHGLSIATGMTREQAATFIDKYKGLRQPLFTYMNQILTEARKKGYVETMFGRRRPMPDIHSANFAIRTAAERAAINMPIQGTEADLMKLAMVRIDKLLSEQYPTCQMLLQIHDSIVVECSAAEATAISKTIQNAMQSVYELPVRLDVDVTIGDNWGQL